MSSDVAITNVLKLGAFAREPFVHQAPGLKMQVNFMYGETDWMSRSSADSLLQSGQLPPGSSCATIPQAGHQHLNDNPLSTAIHTIGLVHGPVRAAEYEARCGAGRERGEGLVERYGPHREALY